MSFSIKKKKLACLLLAVTNFELLFHSVKFPWVNVSEKREEMTIVMNKECMGKL